MVQLLLDIRSQATRKDRASEDKPYLLTDLEIIARKAQQALDARDDGPRPPFYGMMELVGD
jgi:hypothetical protein